MENEPTFNDYVALIYNRFEAFVQVWDSNGKVGHPYMYQQQSMIVFFMWMQFRRIYHFKTQWRWLKGHPEAWQHLGWECVPDRSTLSRRYKALYPCLQEFTRFLAQDSAAWGMGCVALICTRIKVCSKRTARSGIKRIGNRGASPTSCGIWTPMPPGRKAPNMVGCTAMGCI